MSKFFLYNGVKLPALPEWDKTVYPYAFIYIVTLDGTTGVYTLVVSSSSVMGYDGNGIICPSATVGQRYTVSEDSWAAAAASDDFYIKRDNLIYTVWANFDVLNSDGSVYVAASEPVPVAGKFPLREWVGWLIAGLCSRPLPVSVREPVAYLYNGVRLPPLPEWDRTTYPYYYLYHTKIVTRLICIESYECTETAEGIAGMGWGVECLGSYLSTTLENGVWGPVVVEGIWAGPNSFMWNIAWANFTLLNEDGSVYREASKPDPIPVYE